jgi:calmodulin-regulated spectrin-associated protein
MLCLSFVYCIYFGFFFQSAHMAVIEAIMVLYAKEVVTPDRVIAAIQRFSHSRAASPDPLPADHEEGLVLWVNKACSALKQRMVQELEQGDFRGREVTARYH